MSPRPQQCTGHGQRGCPCAFHVRRRRRGSAWRRAKRRKALEGVRQQLTVCPRRAGKHPCRGRLETIVDQLGRMKVICAWCERREAGVCRDCPAPVYGRRYSAIYCAAHARAAKRAAEHRHREAHKEAIAARAKERYWGDPEKRARDNEYKRLWRKANPEKVRAQKARHIARQQQDVSSRYVQYHARYRARHRLYYREQQLVRRRSAPPRVIPPCTKCGKPTGYAPIPDRGGRAWKTCMRCCFPFQRRERRRLRREAAKRQRQLAQLAPKPVKVRSPKAPATRGPGFERLCLTPGCETVVTHRKKKCSKCRAAERARAEAALALVRGKGRRIDLERVA